jgi:hypothetical protein
MRNALIGALVLVGVGVALGATVFRTDIAQATGLAQDVNVTNTSDQAVPTREQNLDSNGNINVHEQGTVSVRSADEEVSVKGSAVLAGSQCAAPNIYTVPAGKNLVLEYIAGRAVGEYARRSGGTGGAWGAIAVHLPNFDSATLPLVFERQTATVFAASEAVHYVVPGGSTLVAMVELPDATNCQLQVSLGGQLQSPVSGGGLPGQ